MKDKIYASEPMYLIGWKTGPNAEVIVELNTLRYDTLEKAKSALERAVESAEICTDDVHREDLGIFREVITWELV